MPLSTIFQLYCGRSSKDICSKFKYKYQHDRSWTNVRKCIHQIENVTIQNKYLFYLKRVIALKVIIIFSGIFCLL